MAATTLTTGDVAAADRNRRVDTVDADSVVVDIELDFSSELGDRVGVVDRDPSAHRGERHGSVHRAGVEVLETEPARHGPPDGALAGTRGTIDGDHQRITMTSRGARPSS